MANFERTWSDEEIERIKSIWNSPVKVENFGEHFPGRLAQSVYSYGRKMLKLGPRRIPQDFDAFLSWKKIEALLATGPKTARQISTCTGMRADKILEMLRRRRGRICHVGEYTSPGKGGRQMIWVLGPGEDAPRPPTISRTEISRRYREKVKRERPEDHEMWSKKRKLREKIKAPGFAKRDPAASWF